MTPGSLPRASDNARDQLGPSGQTVMAGVPAQLGLDGRAYDPSSPAKPATEPPPEGAANPQLGPLHDVSGQTRSPQLEMWALHDQARHLLLCRCAGGEFLTRVRWDGSEERYPNPIHQQNVKDGRCLNRCAKCGLVPREKQVDLPLERSERGAYTFSGVVICHHWTCPSCGARFARDTSTSLDCMFKAWLARNEGYHEEVAPHDVWMLTLTPPHFAHDPMVQTIERLHDAWDFFVEDRRWKAWCATMGVQARVRAFDVTFGGKNGTHPHFHVALFIDGEPGHRWVVADAKRRARSYEDKLAASVIATPELALAWLSALRRAGVPILGADDERVAGVRAHRESDVLDVGVKLQGGDEAAAYFTKWGMSSEVSSTALKKDSPLALVRTALAGDAAAGELYREFCFAVRGRQVISGMKRAMRIVGVGPLDVEEHRKKRQAFLDEQFPPTLVAPLALVVRRELWSRAVTVGFGAVVAEVDRADQAGENPQQALDDFLWQVVPSGRIGARARASPS